MPASDIKTRILGLRQWMGNHGISVAIIPSTDPHGSEYPPEYWRSRAWLTGFTGSAGVAIVTMSEATLWTDSRYYLAAEEQLQGTGIVMQQLTPYSLQPMLQWVERHADGGGIGIDAAVFSTSEALAIEVWIRDKAPQFSLVDMGDPFAELWSDRPTLPPTPISHQPDNLAGRSAADKLADIRHEMQENKCDRMVLCSLDEIAWTLNLRGGDVRCNPVAVAYCLIANDSATLYTDRAKAAEVAAGLNGIGVKLKNYDDIADDLRQVADRTWLPDSASYRLYKALKPQQVLLKPSPVAPLKALKTEAEIEGFRRAMLRDGVALVKWLRWLKPAVEAGGQTELTVDERLTQLRAAQEQFYDISFGTIAGYEAHGAIVHYEADAMSAAPLAPSGLLLVDSGAQYRDGTTDITRTIALGPVTEEQRHIYTLVLKGHIALARLRFPDGASGTQIDMAARQFMWHEGLNYGHGTGHGVGSYLNVHEGPHQIRQNYIAAPLHAGMTVTNEPGLYLAGRFGVRIENMMLTRHALHTECGDFLEFETLTLCPIDTAPIDFTMMTAAETDWLNSYHATVRERLLPLLDDEADRQWLVSATQPVCNSSL